MKRQSVIDQLRRKYPGYWTYSREYGPTWTNGTLTIRAYSQLSPKFDGDDSSCISVYIDQDGKQIGACGFVF